MSSAIAIVRDFFAAWEHGGALEAPFRRYLAADVEWQNVGLSHTHGVDAAIDFMAQAAAAAPMQGIRVELLSIAISGTKVLTERIDSMLASDGSVMVAIPVMGALEVDNGQIVHWRDYFDPAPFRPSTPA